MSPYRAALAALLLTACDKAPAPEASSGARARPSSGASALVAASASAPAAPSAAASASAAAVASAAASSKPTGDGPCAAGARKNDDARYCITLPAKVLAVSYEGDKPSQGIREELEVAGDRLVISVAAAPSGKAVAQLKADALKRIGAELVESGDLTSGYWTDLKEKSGQHIVEGVVMSRYLVTCTHWVRDEKNLEAARAVCKSLTTF